jgi:predicted small metal-binding protein
MVRITCVCGQVLEADEDDDVWRKPQGHIRTDHPDLVGKISRDDILAQAEKI